MSTGLPKTNFTLLEREFDEIIEVRNGANGLPSSPNAVRKTIVFDDLTKLSVQEFIKDGTIDYYNYDLYDSDKKIMLKIHSEQHQGEEVRTKTEPYHLHVLSDADDLKASKRLPFPSEEFKSYDLYSFIQYILFSRNFKFVFVESSSQKSGKEKK